MSLTRSVKTVFGGLQAAAMALHARDRAFDLSDGLSSAFAVAILFQKTAELMIAEAERLGGFALMSLVSGKRRVDQAGFKQANLILKRDIKHRRGWCNGRLCLRVWVWGWGF